MMNIKVCVGSSCHLKGSYDVIQSLNCLGHCAKGVNVRTDGLSDSMKQKATTLEEDGSIILHNVTKENVEEIFVKEIYPLIEL